MRVLTVDYDGRRLGLPDLVARMDRAGRVVVGVWDVRSPSGEGWHRVIAVDPPPETAMEQVALQLVAGSDPYREAYAVRRARAVDSGHVGRFWRERFAVLYGKAAV